MFSDNTFHSRFFFFLVIFTSSAGMSERMSSAGTPVKVNAVQKKEAEIRAAVRKRHRKREWIQGSVAFGATIGGGYATYLLGNANVGLSMVAASTIARRMEHDLPFLLSKLTPKGWFLSEKNEYQQMLHRLEEEFEVRRSKLSPFNEQMIFKTMQDLQTNIDSFLPGYTYMGFLIQTGFKRLGGLMSLPVESVKTQNRDKVFAMLGQHLSTFDHSLRTEILKIVFRMMAQAEGTGSTGLPKASYFFVGEAGHGENYHCLSHCSGLRGSPIVGLISEAFSLRISTDRLTETL